MKDENMKKNIETKIYSELFKESISNYDDTEIKKLLSMLEESNFKDIESQCKQVKDLFDQIFKQNVHLAFAVLIQNNIPKEEIESFSSNMVELQVNYGIALDVMLNNILAKSILLTRKADVMPSIMGEKYGKLNHQQSKDVKNKLLSFAKEKWAKDESIFRTNIIDEFKKTHNVSEVDVTLKRWLAKVDPVTTRGARRTKDGKIIEPKQ